MQILILFVAVLSGGNVEQNSSQETSSVNYPPIPEKVTSFGAAVLDGQLYIYGGHTGGAHAYDKNSQANTLRRLDLGKPKAWQALAQGPGLQGLALVACNGKLYRVGGFTAKNEKGDDHDLWSQAGVACYDPATNQWTDLSPLPEPRSSFDSAVLDKKIYVIGGWKLAGDEEEHWHKSACVLDLSAATPQWQKIPEPPFQRRALAVAAFDGKIYTVSGWTALDHRHSRQVADCTSAPTADHFSNSPRTASLGRSSGIWNEHDSSTACCRFPTRS
jgi:N-acetylneuraminic acid mutarotase